MGKGLVIQQGIAYGVQKEVVSMESLILFVGLLIVFKMVLSK